MGPVAAGNFQGSTNKLPFEFFLGLFDGERISTERTIGLCQLPDWPGEDLRGKPPFFGKKQPTLDAILQFTDIAWPGISQEQLHRLGRNRHRRSRFAEFLAVFFQEMGNEQGDILLSFPERRQGDTDHVKAEI